MSNVVKMPEPPKHVFETGYCVGCGLEIIDQYVDVAMTNVSGTQINHIALCLECNEIAEKHAAY